MQDSKGEGSSPPSIPSSQSWQEKLKKPYTSNREKKCMEVLNRKEERLTLLLPLSKSNRFQTT